MENNAMQLSPEAVKLQLQQLLKNEELRRSPILTRFLEYVVLTKLAGHEEEIKEYTIATKVLGRPLVFNPQLDAIVRIHASRLRGILLRYYQSEGANARILISIPKGRYVPLFELINGSVQHYVSPPVESTLEENRHLSLNEVHKKPVLAVLSFHDLSPEQSNVSFLSALGEQLSTELAKFDNLSVISFYATQKMDALVDHLKDLKNEGIDYILTGSLRLFNSTLKLNIQLMSVDNGNIFWSDSFLHHQVTDENAFDAQDEIISQVVNVIADDPKMMSTLDKWRQSETLHKGNLVQDAIDMYFNYTHDYNTAKFEATLQAAENAHKIEADNVLIVSILSKLYLDQYACATDHNKNLLQKGIELANKAVFLDPRSQFAQKVLAWALIISGDKHKAEEAIDHCIDINPAAASTLSTLGLGLIMRGEFEKGYAMLKKSMNLYHSPYACAKLGFALYYYQYKDYQESSRWLHLLPPFDVPFCRLLQIALNGKLKSVAVQADMSLSEMRGQAKDIIGRIVFDPKLRTGIFEGWKLAGFVA